MKKVLSLILVVAMALSMLSVAAFADAPSKEAEVEITTSVEGATVTVSTEGAAEELKKLNEASSASEYFGIEVEGEVREFVALTLTGFEKAEGDVVLKAATPSKLENGAAVTVLFGIPADGSIDWTAFPGTVMGDVINITIPADFARSMENAGTALMAICA